MSIELEFFNQTKGMLEDAYFGKTFSEILNFCRAVYNDHYAAVSTHSYARIKCVKDMRCAFNADENELIAQKFNRMQSERGIKTHYENQAPELMLSLRLAILLTDHVNGRKY